MNFVMSRDVEIRSEEDLDISGSVVAGDDIEIKAHRRDIGKKGNGTVTWPKAFIEGSFGVV